MERLKTGAKRRTSEARRTPSLCEPRSSPSGLPLSKRERHAQSDSRTSRVSREFPQSPIWESRWDVLFWKARLETRVAMGASRKKSPKRVSRTHSSHPLCRQISSEGRVGKFATRWDAAAKEHAALEPSAATRARGGEKVLATADAVNRATRPVAAPPVEDAAVHRHLCESRRKGDALLARERERERESLSQPR